MGNVIVDIKPYKENRDRTIFVFQDTEKLQADLDRAALHEKVQDKENKENG